MPGWVWLAITILAAVIVIVLAMNLIDPEPGMTGAWAVGILLAMWGMVFLTCWTGSNISQDHRPPVKIVHVDNGPRYLKA